MGMFVKQTVFVFIFILCLQIVSAATISGSVYDLSLQPVSNVIIEINSTPKQLLVSKSGDYAFNVKPGVYTLYAHTDVSIANESITVPDNDTYTLDLILQESMVEIPDYILSDNDVNVSLNDFSEPKRAWMMVLVIVLVLLALFAIGFYFFIRAKLIKSVKLMKSIKHSKRKSKHKSTKLVQNNQDNLKQEQSLLNDYDNKVLSIIKKEKRTTQKDLRKEIPLSEAKISLIITDLESKGKIRKIKKGRGNILIFIKD